MAVENLIKENLSHVSMKLRMDWQHCKQFCTNTCMYVKKSPTQHLIIRLQNKNNTNSTGASTGLKISIMVNENISDILTGDETRTCQCQFPNSFVNPESLTVKKKKISLTVLHCQSKFGYDATHCILLSFITTALKKKKKWQSKIWVLMKHQQKCKALERK